MDSIKVVQELDCDYLWVDRHCINQDPKDPDKGEQIQRMDEIYSQACFTIIDAAGVDCTSGLAGVNLPRQSDPVQRYAQVNGVNLTYLGTPPAEQIRSSRWASRGWTYQEGILSHRRIFFTNEQVIFQCNNMTCLESFDIPMSILHQIKAPNLKMKPILKDFEPLVLADNNLGSHLMEFSKRDLTYDKDSLNAFLGILNVYRREKDYFHFHGNPFQGEKRCMINAWYHIEPGTRKADFPSWSWTGWKGAIKMTSYENPDHDVKLVTEAEGPITLDEYMTACKENPPQEIKPAIELTGKMTTLSFELIKWGSESILRNRDINEPTIQDGPWAILPITTDITCYSFLYLDNEALTGLYQFKLPIIVLEFGTISQDHNLIILVLREKGDHFERVGLITSRDAFKYGNKEKDNQPKPTFYKDKGRGWMTRALIPKPEDPIWEQELKKETIVLK
ncbi:Heterokaryon incompatibility [Fusarium oxysporum f. sp. vasinfectum]|nr:Heterokaryon incompatibility [Fusarium oxysporum f. sp. vasinfectum]